MDVRSAGNAAARWVLVTQGACQVLSEGAVAQRGYGAHGRQDRWAGVLPGGNSRSQRVVVDLAKFIVQAPADQRLHLQPNRSSGG